MVETRGVTGGHALTLHLRGGPLELGDLDLPHLQHRLHHALRPLAVGVAQQLGQRASGRSATRGRSGPSASRTGPPRRPRRACSSSASTSSWLSQLDLERDRLAERELRARRSGRRTAARRARSSRSSPFPRAAGRPRRSGRRRRSASSGTPTCRTSPPLRLRCRTTGRESDCPFLSFRSWSSWCRPSQRFLLIGSTLTGCSRGGGELTRMSADGSRRARRQVHPSPVGAFGPREGGTQGGAAAERTATGSRRQTARPGRAARAAVDDAGARAGADPVRADARLAVHLLPRRRGDHGVRPRDHAALRLDVQLCGDAHLSNFGVFATPERQLVFDINDFDETLPGPWEWDVKRLAASFAVAGRGRTGSRRSRGQRSSRRP